MWHCFDLLKCLYLVLRRTQPLIQSCNTNMCHRMELLSVPPEPGKLFLSQSVSGKTDGTLPPVGKAVAHISRTFNLLPAPRAQVITHLHYITLMRSFTAQTLKRWLVINCLSRLKAPLPASDSAISHVTNLQPYLIIHRLRGSNMMSQQLLAELRSIKEIQTCRTDVFGSLMFFRTNHSVSSFTWNPALWPLTPPTHRRVSWWGYPSLADAVTALFTEPGKWLYCWLVQFRAAPPP